MFHGLGMTLADPGGQELTRGQVLDGWTQADRAILIKKLVKNRHLEVCEDLSNFCPKTS